LQVSAGEGLERAHSHANEAPPRPFGVVRYKELVAMAIERTFFIIKPDAVERAKAGAILSRIEESGFKIVALKRGVFTRAMAEGFYAEHKARPFFGELCDFMTRSAVVYGVLEKEGAVAAWRSLMGATDPAKADANTLRKVFGTNVGENAVHGSDSLESARREISFFFAGHEASPVASAL
jgi:nucleoside-diphosphate kinase